MSELLEYICTLQHNNYVLYTFSILITIVYNYFVINHCLYIDTCNTFVNPYTITAQNKYYYHGYTISIVLCKPKRFL